MLESYVQIALIDSFTMNTFIRVISGESHVLVETDGGLTVSMDNMYADGDWGSVDRCTVISYAAGIQLTVRY